MTDNNKPEQSPVPMSAQDAIYAKAAAMDNQDVPLEEWPNKLIAALHHAGFCIVPKELPCGVLGDAAIVGVFDTGNPKHGWDYLLTRVAVKEAPMSEQGSNASEPKAVVPEGAVEAFCRRYRKGWYATASSYASARIRTEEDATRAGLAAALPHLLAANPGAGAQAPKGWRLVPEQPTDEMMGAFASINFTGDEVSGLLSFHGDLGNLIACYREMLAAAPTPEGERQQ